MVKYPNLFLKEFLNYSAKAILQPSCALLYSKRFLSLKLISQFHAISLYYCSGL